MWKETDLVKNNNFLLSIPSVQPQELVTCKLGRFIITARKRSLRRLCFHRCLSVHRGGVCPIACWDTHPTGPEADTHWADTPLSKHPLSKYPLGRHPLHTACWDTVNKRAVRIPLEYILVYIGVCRVHICDFLTWIYNFSLGFQVTMFFYRMGTITYAGQPENAFMQMRNPWKTVMKLV